MVISTFLSVFIDGLEAEKAECGINQDRQSAYNRSRKFQVLPVVS